MTPGQVFKVVGAAAAFSAVIVTGMFLSSTRGRADDRGYDSDSRIEQGFEIAPVHLNLEGKNRALVGLGSYIVNAQADCDGCHSAGPRAEFAIGENPYSRHPHTINPAPH